LLHPLRQRWTVPPVFRGMAAPKEDPVEEVHENEDQPEAPKASKRNERKRSLKEIDDEEEADDVAVPRKKRKLNADDNKTEEEEEGIAESFKICCYNLNGIRSAAKKGLEEYIEQEDADIVCFSEMKAKESQNPCSLRGYQVIWCECTDKAGYAGTAVLSKTKPLNITRGIGSVDGEGRALTLEFDKFFLVNTYVPNSGQNLKFKQRRLEWDVAMKRWLSDLQDRKPVIWTGDLNVAILDFDVYDGETNKARKKTPGFTPYERDNFRKLSEELDLVDSYRHFHPAEREKHYTFFSQRGRAMKDQNKGWRLDYFMVSRQIVNILEDVEVRREKAYSDHVPLVLTMKHPDVALC